MSLQSGSFNRRSLPPLNTLRCFEAVARLNSVTQAAKEIGITHGAVSRQIRKLEEHVGQDLFERDHRRVLLNAAGKKLHKVVELSLAAIDRTVSETRRELNRDEIVLACAPTLMMRWLIPRLPDLRRQVPGIRLIFDANRYRDAHSRSQIDLAIDREEAGQPVSSGHRMELMKVAVGPICTPALAAKLRHVDDLASMTMLHTHGRPSEWPRWLQSQNSQVNSENNRWFDNYNFCLKAAAAGLGVAIGPQVLAHDDIAAGVLVAPFGFKSDQSRYVLTVTRSAAVPAGRQVLAWAQRALGDAALTLP